MDLAAFVRLMPNPVALTRRADGRFLEVSPAYEAFVGRSRDALVGRTVVEAGILAASEREAMRPLWDSAAKPQEMTVTSADGATRSAIVQGVAVDAQGVPAYLVVLTDISDRKHAEADLRTERELHEALLHAQSDAGEAICIVDMESQRAVYLNDALRRMYGMAPGEMGSPNMYDRVPPDERERLAEAAKKRDASDPGPSITEMQILRNDGARLPIEVVIQRFTVNGRPHMLTIVRDLTRKKEAEQALRDSHLSRAFVRRLLTHVINKARVSEEVVREMGRQIARESASGDLEASLAAFRTLGLGALRQEKTEGKAYTFSGQDLLETRPGSAQTTCYLTLSFLEGAVAKKHGTQALGSETRCRSRGHEACVFVVVAR